MQMKSTPLWVMLPGDQGLGPFRGPLNPDSMTIGNIRRGDPLGEMSRNTSFFTELKYSF